MLEIVEFIFATFVVKTVNGGDGSINRWSKKSKVKYIIQELEVNGGQNLCNTASGFAFLDCSFEGPSKLV